jgi:hypothetical protein
VPPFRVGAGQAVCLHVPLPSPTWCEQLLPVLTGKIAHPALRFFGSVRHLERPLPRRRWWRGLHDPSVRDWLTREKGLTPAEAADILGRVALPSDLRVGRVGWNERTMLALEVCLLRAPDLLVFDSAGNDPLGVCRTFERLATRLPGMALLYLKTRLAADEPCLPEADCVAVGCRLLPAPAAE